jgi:S1-C subfamily serine protease
MLSKVTTALALSVLTGPVSAGPYNEAGPAVVQIHVYGTLRTPDPKTRSPDFDDHATGFFVTPDGLILTAGHVAPDPSLFQSGQLWIEGLLPKLDEMAMVASQPVLELEVIKSSTSPHDVGLLRVKNPSGAFPFLRLCDGYTTEDNLTVLGYSGGYSTLSKTLGSVKSPASTLSPLVMQMPLSPGDSGGPVFNANGQVFGIAIGQRTVNGERMEATTLAEIMPKAMTQLSPETLALIGVSYDPDCAKQLVSAAANPPDFQDKKTGGFLKDGKLTQSFQAPHGYKFKNVMVSAIVPGGIFGQSVEGKADVAEDGKSVELSIPGDWSSFEGKLQAKLVPERPPIAASTTIEPQVRSFAISGTLDTHGPSKTRKKFDETIIAPDGFRFRKVVGISYPSLNHSPSNGLTTDLARDGSSIHATYELESGPNLRPVARLD